MLKKLILAVIVIGAGVLVYTESTGKTQLKNTIYQAITGDELVEDETVDEEGHHYKLVGEQEKPLSAGDQAIKDAGEYHAEAKDFAGKAKNTADAINEAGK